MPVATTGTAHSSSSSSDSSCNASFANTSLRFTTSLRTRKQGLCRIPSRTACARVVTDTACIARAARVCTKHARLGRTSANSTEEGGNEPVNIQRLRLDHVLLPELVQCGYRVALLAVSEAIARLLALHPRVIPQGFDGLFRGRLLRLLWAWPRAPRPHACTTHTEQQLGTPNAATPRVQAG